MLLFFFFQLPNFWFLAQFLHVIARYFNHNLDNAQAVTVESCNCVASPERPAVLLAMPISHIHLVIKTCFAVSLNLD